MRRHSWLFLLRLGLASLLLHYGDASARAQDWLFTANLEPIEGKLKAGNSAVVHVSLRADGGDGAQHVVSYDLSVSDPRCQAVPTAANGCGVHLHEASSCLLSDIGGHAWNKTTVSKDPWVDVRYQLDPRGGGNNPAENVNHARGHKVVGTGLEKHAFQNLRAVVHDFEGDRLLCGQLRSAEAGAGDGDGCYTEGDWRDQFFVNMSGAFERCGQELVCRQGHRRCQATCVLSEECQRFPLRTCDADTLRCRHKDVFASPAGADAGVAVLFLLISGMALSAGIGGGGLYVPLLMVVLGFTIKEATALSQACLAGGATTNLFYTMRQQHPTERRPAIDYDLVLIMGPCLLIGALAGSEINKAAPSWVILLVLMVVLVRSAYEAAVKARQKWREESVAVAEKGRSNMIGKARLGKNPIERILRALGGGSYDQFNDGATNAGTPSPQVVGSQRQPETEVRGPSPADAHKCDGADVVDGSGIEVDLASHSAELSASDADTSSTRSPQPQTQFPLPRIGLLFAMWLVTIISVLARGGEGASGIVPYCSTGYWLLAGLSVVMLQGVGLLGVRQAIRINSDASDGGSVAAPGGDATTSVVVDSKGWTAARARRVALWALLAGTLASLCGIGGGMVMGPLLLRMGVLPKVQAATTGTTLFVMSTSTCLAFLVQGAAPPGYAAFLATVTGAGALLGKVVIGWIVKRSGRESLLTILLTGIIVLSVCVMGVSGVLDVAADIRNNRDLGFRGFCTAP